MSVHINIQQPVFSGIMGIIRTTRVHSRCGWSIRESESSKLFDRGMVRPSSHTVRTTCRSYSMMVIELLPRRRRSIRVFFSFYLTANPRLEKGKLIQDHITETRLREPSVIMRARNAFLINLRSPLLVAEHLLSLE